MIIVGIDIAKNKHDAIIIDAKGDSLTKSFRIPNSHKGANTLIDRIKTANPNNLPVVVGIEAIRHYWLPLYSRLIQEGFEVNQLIEQIKFIKSQITALKKQIQALLEKLDTPIQTLPGVGPVLVAIILSEIGDISRFKNASKLVTFTAIDPTVKQSGEFIATHNKMSKRGSPYLRRAVFLAAQVATFNDSVLSAYYQKKRAEGKHHYTAIGSVARKLLYITFAVLTRNQPYTSIA